MGRFLILILESTDSRLKSWNRELAAECRSQFFCQEITIASLGQMQWLHSILRMQQAAAWQDHYLFHFCQRPHTGSGGNSNWISPRRCAVKLRSRSISAYSERLMITIFFSKHTGSRGAWMAVGILLCYLFSVTQ